MHKAAENKEMIMAAAPSLQAMRDKAPSYGMKGHKDWDDKNTYHYAPLTWIALRIFKVESNCSYCGWRRVRTSILVVNPIHHNRHYVSLCNSPRCHKNLREWEQMGEARLRRSQRDWELQHPDQVEYQLTPGMPAQYPSVSRAVLRAFVASGEDAMTVGSGTSVTAINGSIRRLGYTSQVYAEIRSGQTVLRRSPRAKSD